MLKGLFKNILFAIRNYRCREMFKALKSEHLGHVLDVGGGEFYRYALQHGVCFDTWTVLEKDLTTEVKPTDEKVKFLSGDGCNIQLADKSFDSVLSFQVVEHVFEPIKMVSECCRVLKNGGKLFLLAPQTSTIHCAPNHYYNFTRFWLLEAMQREKLRVIKLLPLGGRWSSIASNLLYFIFQALNATGMTVKEYKRGVMFWLMFPFMLLFAVVAIPICLVFSLADLKEEPNNHFLVAIKE